MADRLKNKVALITGAARGIGKEIAKLFLEEGAHVIATDKDLEELQKTKVEFDSIWTTKSSIHEMNTTESQTVSDLVSNLLLEYDCIDILINNAGKNVFDEPHKLSNKQWEECYNLNLKGTWNCSKALLPHFLENKYGNVVNIASVHGHKIIKGCFPYPVFKHGLLGLTKSLAIEYASNNLRFNSISPGLILTPAIESYFREQDDPEKERKKQTDIIPCKRIGTPQEVAMTVLFLASDEASFINATDIKIDGGRSELYND